jgi:hypothetical protein
VHPKLQRCPKVQGAPDELPALRSLRGVKPVQRRSLTPDARCIVRF